MAKLERARLEYGQTKQTFVLAAVLDALARWESERDEKSERKRLGERRFGGAPTGLGLGLRREAKVQPVAPPEAPVSVYVNSNGKGNDLLDTLADYVASAPSFERDSRMRTALDILRTNTKTPDEHRALARRLEEEIKARTPEQPGELDILRRGAASVYNQFKGFIR